MTTRSEITWLKRRRKYSGSGHNMNHHHGGLQDSPLVVGLLGVMAGSLIVAILHCFIVCRCNDNIPRATRMTTSTGTGTARTPTTSQRQNVGAQGYAEQASTSSSGSFSSVQVIVTSNYINRGSIDEICAVCLSEFNQGDEVRVLPECAHTFHVPCIDKWLHSHRNCPLCRAETLPSPRDVVPSLPHPAGVPVSSSELYRIPDLSA